MKITFKNACIILLNTYVLAGCNIANSNRNQHFSDYVVDLSLAQTDDEKTAIGEYNDMINNADSLWNMLELGTDSFHLRKYVYYYLESYDVVRFKSISDKMHPNIRENIRNKIQANNDSIREKLIIHIPNARELQDFYKYLVIQPSLLDWVKRAEKAFNTDHSADISINEYGETYSYYWGRKLPCNYDKRKLHNKQRR